MISKVKDLSDIGVGMVSFKLFFKSKINLVKILIKSNTGFPNADDSQSA